ncbi:MAG: hypothetical protein WCC58_02860, partial [Burkholderiales bacterium]
NGTLGSDTSFTVPNTNSPVLIIYPVIIGSDASQSANAAGSATPFTCSNTVSSGLLTISITTPLGVNTTFNIPVTD